MSSANSNPSSSQKASTSEVFVEFLKLGLTSFGGPVAHIGFFQRRFVDQLAWLDAKRFASLLALCQFLPGPASSQLGFAIALQRGGLWAAVAAFFAFTLPSVLILLCLVAITPYLPQWLYSNMFGALKLLAVVVVADALWGMGQSLCNSLFKRILALAVALALSIGSIGPWPLLLLAALLGLLFIPVTNKLAPDRSKFTIKRSSVVCLATFLGLLLLTMLPKPDVAGGDQQALLWYLASEFYQVGSLVFGGGHVVLPLLQSSVLQPGLLSEAEFLSAYGSAQIVPGPMFSIAAYLGAVAGAQSLSLQGAVVALLAIFLPGFLLLMAVLPYWQKVMNNRQLAAVVAGVNAAVVGLLLASFFHPVLSSAIYSYSDVVVVAFGFYAIRFLGWSMLYILPLLLLAAAI
ncbi:chromate efflux transporter [uncultured Pseudoteredinibacter sp.]|uniref:chromate efflux transporter n=1 Tax=uncultured Pseudoteredinibacter sp. TaxID=1641701 RepID=UPI0026268ED3|nr:chromate efflux transporter [uncultured Pseudoteredinibacter sp.]